MRLYQIFLLLIALLFNLVNGYFWINPRISSEFKKHTENLIKHLNVKSDLKKNIDLDDNLNSLTNSVNPIEILPEDFFESEEPIIQDDGDFVNIPKLSFPPKNKPNPHDKPSQSNKLAPIHPIASVGDIGSNELILSEIIINEQLIAKPEPNVPIEIGRLEHFPRPRPEHNNRLGNLRGTNEKKLLNKRNLQFNYYDPIENIFDYVDFNGHELNPDVYPDSKLGLETNTQSECATANYLRKAGFLESSIGTMVCIAKYESGFNCDATNKNIDGSTDYGEFQINSYWWCSGDPKSKYNGCSASCSSLFDCQANANCAYTVWKQQGYNAWYGYQNHKSTCDSYPKPC